MEKRQLIEAIRALNPHATDKFLEQFTRKDLARYLERLQNAEVRNISLAAPQRRRAG